MTRPQKNRDLVKRENVVVDSVVRQVGILYTAISHRLLSCHQLIGCQYLH